MEDNVQLLYNYVNSSIEKKYELYKSCINQGCNDGRRIRDLRPGAPGNERGLTVSAFAGQKTGHGGKMLETQYTDEN